MNRARREASGRRAEWLAALYLRCKGWRILARRIRTPRGEIDLIARRGRTVAFIEVKWRSNTALRDAALDPWRMRRVVAAAQAIGHRYAAPGDDQRIDALLLAPWRWPRHMANITLV